MLKKLTIAAMAAVSMIAVAQEPGKAAMAPRSMWHEVMDYATGLNAGDQWELASWLNRMPSQYELTVVEALANTHRSAWTISDSKHAMRFQRDEMVDKRGNDRSGKWGYWENWSMSEENMRPMRMVMERVHPRVITYDETLDILQSGLNGEDRSKLFNIWMNAPERVKDALTRYVAISAGMGDWGWRR